MNDDILNTYSRLVASSQQTMQNVITIISNQETALRHVINRNMDDTTDTIHRIRRENESLRRTVNIQNRLLREQDRVTIPRPPSRSLPRTDLNNDWINIGVRQPIIPNLVPRQTTVRPNISIVPNNQTQYMRNYLTDIPNLLFGTIGDTLSPVIIRPTNRQVRESTELVRFGSMENPQNNTCPISLERFNDQQLVTRIIFCGHVYSTNELQTWFETNVRCPLCRFDIREHRNQASRNNLSTDNQNVENSEENSEENINQPEPMPYTEEEEEELFDNMSENINHLLNQTTRLDENLTEHIASELARTISQAYNSSGTINNIFHQFNDISNNNFVNDRTTFINHFTNSTDLSNNG
tara:strand:+ start:2494 stop:3552 length:1059 start_codon:yes stop_codon:yes gene_type:complete